MIFLFLVSLLLVSSYIQLHDEIPQQGQQLAANQPENRMLYFVPGASFKYLTTWETIDRNLQQIDNTSNSDLQLSCIIYVYDDINPPLSHESSRRVRERCRILTYYKGTYGDHIKALPPVLLEMGGFTHILLVLDDVTLTSSYNITSMLTLMKYNQLHMASPVVVNANVGPSKRPWVNDTSSGYGYEVDVLEIHAVLFNLLGWEAFWDLASPKYNTRGLGYERFIKSWAQKYIAVRSAAVSVVKLNQYALHGVLPGKFDGKSNFRIGLVNVMQAIHLNNNTAIDLSPKLKIKQYEKIFKSYNKNHKKKNGDVDHNTERLFEILKSSPCTIEIDNSPQDKDSTKTKLPKKHHNHRGQNITSEQIEAIQRRLASSSKNVMSIDPRCAAKIIFEYENKNSPQWRSWLDLEQLVRGRTLPEMLFRKQGAVLKLKEGIRNK